MPDISNSHAVLLWVTGAAGMVFWATFLRGLFEVLRNGYYGTWMNNLSPTKMFFLALAAFFIPLIIINAVVLYAPVTLYAYLDPWLRFLILALSAYSGQQWLHWKQVGN